MDQWNTLDHESSIKDSSSPKIRKAMKMRKSVIMKKDGLSIDRKQAYLSVHMEIEYDLGLLVNAQRALR